MDLSNLQQWRKTTQVGQEMENSHWLTILDANFLVTTTTFKARNENYTILYII